MSYLITPQFTTCYSKLFEARIIESIDLGMWLILLAMSRGDTLENWKYVYRKMETSSYQFRNFKWL